MKVLSKVNPKEWSGEATCDTCSSRLEVEIADLQLFDDQRDGLSVEFNCPVCGLRNSLPGEFVPSHFRFAIKRGSR